MNFKQADIDHAREEITVELLEGKIQQEEETSQSREQEKTEKKKKQRLKKKKEKNRSTFLDYFYQRFCNSEQ